MKAWRLYIELAVVAVLLLFIGVQTMELHGVKMDLAIHQKNAAIAQAAAHKKFADDVVKIRNLETELQAGASETRKKTNEIVRQNAARHDALLGRLRLAEARAAIRSGTATAGDRGAVAGDPGTELPGTLGAEDVHEARRAETIRIHLKACYADYGRARAALKAAGITK